MRRFGSGLALPALLLLASWTDVAAQTYQGGIRGSVRDANGVIPGVEVQLIQEGTNVTRSSASNESGEYVFTNVLPATYTLKATLTGFKTYERKELRIGTQTFLTIDILLEVGNVAEEITVTGAAPLIETSTASVSSMLDKTTLETLPTAGRNAFFLAVTTPNVTPTGDPQFVRQQDQTNSSLLSLGGGPRRGNNYVLEGVPIVDIRNRASFIPNLEAVEEVRVQVSTFDAEMGRTGGGVFNTTGKSGSNAFHGSGVYQNRPEWAQGKFFFVERTGLPKPESYFHLWGGSFGGPILRNRTFFWGSTEGYKTLTSRNTVQTLPTELERRGNFSQTFDGQGRLVVIYDPLTTRRNPANPSQFIRDPFPNNRIPANRLNPVALAMMQYYPLPTSGKSRAAVAQLVDVANQATLKIDHRWSDKFTTTGMYAWYDSEEPGNRFFGKEVFTNPGDPGDGALLRTVNMIAINNIWVPNNNTVLALRYGYNQFVDDCVHNEFDPSQLGFAQGYLNIVPVKKFPRATFTTYPSLGDRGASDITYYSHNANATFSKFIGRHTVKFGGDYRVTAVRFFNTNQGTGAFSFTPAFTQGPNPTLSGSNAGDAFASFLLGYPNSGSIPVSTPIDAYLNYYAGYVQDDFRPTSKLTINLGLRYEFEQGLQERETRLAVGWAFDQNVPVQVGGVRPDGTPLTLKGGLIYAGQNGAPTHQGDPNKKQFAPRAGVAYSINDTTVLRGGYGLFWAPFQNISPGEAATGTRGYNQATDYVASFDGGLTPCPGCGLTNPFPNGIQQPVGTALGQLAGVGGDIEFIDPRSKMAHVHQYAIDLQRELPNHIAVSVGYVGSRSENLGVGGVNNTSININQLDPKYQSLGTALLDRLPNPFFGTPLGVGILAATTVTRGQLLRPYPQFNGVFMNRTSVAKARYHSLVLKGERRMSDGWAVRANYTFSNLKDSQFGESNFFALGSGILNNYDIDAEYGLSRLDAPHRINITGTLELPFGEGRRWLNRSGITNAVVGGWTVTLVGSVQSGFPTSVSQTSNSGLLGGGQRPNVVPGVDPSLTNDPAGSYDPTCSCIRWLNPRAWSVAPAFTFGNSSRADDRLRTPIRKSWDLAIQKAQRIAGKTVSLRAELINVFNIPDFRGPNVTFGTANFGQIREVGGFPRMLQILARVAW